MPIIDLQMRLRELGRIRTGQTVTNGGKRRPAKLEHFRLTSPSHDLIDAAARLYGGHPRAWDNQWEVVTERDTLDVAIPPGMPLSQWNEMWSGGGCQRRCDGQRNVITDSPCACPADPAERRDAAKEGLACKPTTRLNVMLPDLPDLGVWRLEVHGWYAATELAGAMQLASLSGKSVVRGKLRLEQREQKVPGQPTKKYGVPVLELPDMTIGDLLSGQVRQALPAAVNRRERVERPALPEPPPLHRGSDNGAGAVREPVQQPAAGEVPPAEPAAGVACAALPEKDSPLGLTLPCHLLPDHVVQGKRLHKSPEGSWPAA